VAKTNLKASSRRTPFPFRPGQTPASRREGETTDAQPVPGEEGDIKARQQKVRREMQHPIYFLNIQI
jgi:hypothetical protein